MTYQAKVAADGTIVIPAELRRELGIKDGDIVVLGNGAEGSLTIKTHAQMIREGQLAYRASLARPFTVDEFLAGRREEAARE